MNYYNEYVLEQPGSVLVIESEEREQPLPLPEGLPLSILQIFASAQDHALPHTMFEKLQHIMSMGMYYQKDDPRLSEVRRQQAEALESHLRDIGNTMVWTELLLGLLLIWAAQIQLHLYLGYDTVRDWCRSLNIADTKTIQSAMSLAKTWPYLQQLGYSIEEVVDGSIKGPKTSFIQGLAKKAPERLQSYLVEELKQQDDIPITLPDHVSGKDRAIISTAMATLPELKQQEVREQAQLRFLQEARDQVEMIRAYEGADLLIAHQEAIGEPQKLCIVLPVTWRANTLFFGTGIEAGSVECGPSQVAALLKNQYTLRFTIEGVEGTISPRELGDHLAPGVIPYGYDAAPYDDDDTPY